QPSRARARQLPAIRKARPGGQEFREWAEDSEPRGTVKRRMWQRRSCPSLPGLLSPFPVDFAPGIGHKPAQPHRRKPPRTEVLPLQAAFMMPGSAGQHTRDDPGGYRLSLIMPAGTEPATLRQAIQAADAALSAVATEY